jgi:hypothetical protein
MGFTEPDWLRKPQTRDMGAETVNGVRAERWFLDANFTSYDNNYYAYTRGGSQGLILTDFTSYKRTFSGMIDN